MARRTPEAGGRGGGWAEFAENSDFSGKFLVSRPFIGLKASEKTKDFRGHARKAPNSRRNRLSEFFRPLSEFFRPLSEFIRRISEFGSRFGESGDLGARAGAEFCEGFRA